MRKIIIALIAVVAGASSAFAQGGLAIGAKLGTLGAGAELTGYLLPQLNARVGINYASFGLSAEVDGTDYDLDTDFLTTFGLLDWYPFENNFRITAGIGLNNNKLDVTGHINGSTDIGDHSYSEDQISTLKGKATFDDFAPYIGIGYGNAVADNVDLTFSFDLGLMFQGEPEVDLTATGPAANTPQFQADLAKEEQDVQDEADKLAIYPVISFGIAYYFW